MILLALGVAWGQSFRLNRTMREGIAQSSELATSRSESDLHRIEIRAILERISSIPHSSPAITTLRAGSTIRDSVDIPARALLYVIARACGKCPANFPFLARLERSQPGTVIGISVVDESEQLVEYVAKHDLPFPVVASKGGWIHDAIPRHGTPITMLVRDGMLVDLATGELDEEQARVFALQVATP